MSTGSSSLWISSVRRTRASRRASARPPAGDVGRGTEPFDDPAPFVQDRNGARKGPAGGTVRLADAMLKLEDALGPQGLIDGGEHGGLVFRQEIFVHPGDAGALPVVEDAPAVELAHLRPVRAHPIDHVGGRGGQGAKTFLAFAQTAIGEHPFAGIDHDRHDPGGASAFIEDRGIIEIHPHLFRPAMAKQREFLVLVGQRSPGEADLHHSVVEVGNLGPAFAHLGSQQFGMTATGKAGIGVVIDHDAVGPPQEDDRHGGEQQEIGGGFETLRPGGDGSQTGRGPVETADQLAQLSAALWKYGVEVAVF